ncbi:lysozyme [Chitiniphilus purpureus]|uniref:Lysozyme n=1 Tax=Chitiniphilus purpureus TaxID=2981137 RepID=A0ABY6DK86_9NEIS|nr:lysozyme [Chitiniphilus sp. CD1]UXY14754.1 lysozyme [Chitiniphilus sp. CD1]
MDKRLRNRLVAASVGGALSIAVVLQGWFESGDKVYRVPYVDAVGVLTVCDGVTGPEVIKDKLYADAECAALERKHLLIAEAAAKRQIRTYSQLNMWQQAALIDFTYNVGEGNLAGSTLKRRFNAGDIYGGCDELLKWVKGRKGGKLVTLGGLVDRRQIEHELCTEWKS